ncbi:MAG: CDGSH iron-sulfur domain-containing protein [Bacteroidales bacterium]|nr:CDGSH iron-sulfur domain-containing protein [Bacteroidales bacterium]
MDKKNKTRFRVIENGSLEVIGDFSIKGIDGQILDTEEKVYLCRCGASQKRPFCDGEHRKIGFSK